MTIAAGALAFGFVALESCKGEKAEATPVAAEEPVEAVAEGTTGATNIEYDVLTGAQKAALLASKLVDESNFGKSIFIDFNATWCGPCRQFAPYFEAAAQKYAGKASFIAVDVDEYGDVANAFGVQSIPTMIALMPDGKYVTYIGTQGLVGDGAFDGIVKTYLR